MWESFKKFFKDSETIFWARLQVFVGVVWEILAVVDVSPVVPPKYLPYYLMASGVVTEVLRRRRAEM